MSDPLPRYLSIKAAEDAGFATPGMLGKMVRVDRRQVHTWSTRRNRNGFPIVRAIYVAGGRLYPLYSVTEFMTWKRGYEPATSGPRRLVDTVPGS